MRLRIRLFILAILHFFKKRLSLADENTLSLRVLPNDVDFYTISSDRFLPLMDLGRVNIPLRAGMLWTFMKRRWYPIARVVTVRYRYPVKMFQKYQLHSRAIYWDDEWIWTEHHFERNNRTLAIGITKVTIIGPNGIVPVSEFIAAAGESITSPPMPKLVSDLQNIEEQIKELQK